MCAIFAPSWRKAAQTAIQATIGPGCWIVLQEQADIGRITSTLGVKWEISVKNAFFCCRNYYRERFRLDICYPSIKLGVLVEKKRHNHTPD